jgi:FkbM family methyltransferase
VVDVGANRGQYGEWIREAGFSRRITSFEPQAQAFTALKERTAEDANWECHQLALGDRSETVELHIARDSAASSLLPVEEFNLTVNAEAEQIRSESVRVARLDTVWDTCVRSDGQAYLKLDVEGYELAVLRGSEGVIDRVDCVEAELALAPMYSGAPSFLTMVEYLTARGFCILALESNHEDDERGQMAMVDAIFVREAPTPAHAQYDFSRTSPEGA